MQDVVGRGLKNWIKMIKNWRLTDKDNKEYETHVLTKISHVGETQPQMFPCIHWPVKKNSIKNWIKMIKNWRLTDKDDKELETH